MECHCGQNVMAEISLCLVYATQSSITLSSLTTLVAILLTEASMAPMYGTVASH